jgi:hypothetical protein
VRRKRLPDRGTALAEKPSVPSFEVRVRVTGAVPRETGKFNRIWTLPSSLRAPEPTISKASG